jgi:hypothetical protein
MNVTINLRDGDKSTRYTDSDAWSNMLVASFVREARNHYQRTGETFVILEAAGIVGRCTIRKGTAK